MTAFYRLQDGLYHPLQPATAPWTRKHQNGTAVGGLLTQTIERAPTAAPLRLVRVTIELQRAVPLAPTQARARARIVRDGKRQQLVEAELLVEGEPYAKAVGLRVRDGEGPYEAPAPHGLPDPESAPRTPVTSVLGEGHPMQTRVVKGGRGPGPGAYWTRFNADLVAGETASASVRTVMACDIAAGVANGVGPEARRDWSFPNIDLSVYFARAPHGDWILTDAETEQYGAGYGLISSTLSDIDGPFGFARQTLLYAPAKAQGAT
jgi:hypothetical protein